MLENHRILVTGATSGLGRSIAYQLAVKYKAIVIATGRRVERLNDLKDKAAKSNGHIEIYPLDLIDGNQVTQFIEEMTKNGVDGIILNAGITVADNFENGTMEQYRQLIQTNII